MYFELPWGPRHIVNAMEESGYEAYTVGGCVRDMIMGKEPHDYDICTSAPPDETIRIFNDYKLVKNGIKHGTVAVVFENELYEVTTFRIDGEYTDRRRPDRVEYTSRIVEDLLRRDFTINAIAYSPLRGIVDLSGGVEDILKGVIRCVGDADKRFNEDALRILRAWRFACKLGFTIEEKTLESAHKNMGLLKDIAAERVYSEFMNALIHTRNFVRFALKDDSFLKAVIPEWADMKLDQKNEHHVYTVDVHTLKALEAAADCDIYTKLALLLHDIGKPPCFTTDENGCGHFYTHAKVGAEMSRVIFERLKAPSHIRDTVCELVLYHDMQIQADKKCIKRRLNKLGEEQLRRIINIKRADVSAQNPVYTPERLAELDEIERLLDEVIAENSCFTVRDLAINGDDLIEMGFKPGRIIGEIMNELLEAVISESISNERETLLETVRQMEKPCDQYA